MMMRYCFLRIFNSFFIFSSYFIFTSSLHIFSSFCIRTINTSKAMMLGNQQRDDPEAISRASCMEGKYRPGTLVWAKVFGYPYWPAVIEGDPDEGTYSKDLTTSPPLTQQPKFNVLYLAPYAKGSEEPLYYRARIMQIQSTKVSVFYVDFGNVECIDISEL
ncbi:uncharacterized protein LOC129958059 [Argiope bruennichi]|uniref:uncharacterized protein LOC129958059 n=1 Tax=Argiope bruennichi TaxID=94029 RepID=UPI002494839E|nr:uncharacterized protein LOC129958059 [Argiope bruennichi]XP_055926199.1 uncharacterized protein LOC129958059 [Argiope bruennichi]